MTEETNILPTSDERMLGALAHFFGIIGALIIWVLQKDKSRFVRFQAAQALAFDFVVTLLMMMFSLCFFGVMFLGIFGVTFASLNHAISSENFNPFIAFPFMFPWLMFICILPFSFAFLDIISSSSSDSLSLLPLSISNNPRFNLISWLWQL